MSGTGTSETSSPATSSGQLPDMQPSLPYPHMNMPSIQDLGGPQMKRQRTESFSPESKVVTSSRNFEYGHGSTNWMAPEASPGAKSHPELPPPDLQTPYWRVNHQESPITPAFSPFTPSLQIPPLQTWSNNHPEPSPREDLSWSVPQRSISYSNLEGIQNHHQNPPYASHPQSHPISDHYTTKPRLQHTGMYPPPISTSAGNHPPTEYSPAATSESAQQSQSAGVLPPVTYSQWQQPYSYQKPVGSSSEHYSSWNQTHGPPSVPEGHAQPVHYGYAASGSYYPPPPDQGR
ncbi:hypothetical protein B0O99DRAFT_604437 [Bisporella sp. PMI_857]|nr:hypothetical protein B0O99DRAFT_604437 [Bisporella sp. PMI_857]